MTWARTIFAALLVVLAMMLAQPSRAQGTPRDPGVLMLNSGFRCTYLGMAPLARSDGTRIGTSISYLALMPNLKERDATARALFEYIRPAAEMRGDTKAAVLAYTLRDRRVLVTLFDRDEKGRWHRASRRVRVSESGGVEPFSMAAPDEALLIAARERAELWLTLLDANDIAEAWKEAATEFRQGVDFDAFARDIRASPPRAWSIEGRTWRATLYLPAIPDIRTQPLVLVDFLTRLENAPAPTVVEAVTGALSNGSWVIVGYHVVTPAEQQAAGQRSNSPK